MKRLTSILILLMALNNAQELNAQAKCKVCIFLEYIDVKNNVEIEEIRNEILFEIIQGNEIDCLLQKSKNDSLLQLQIYRELSTPINDCIDLDNCKLKLQKREDKFSFVIKWIEAINNAIRKRD